MQLDRAINALASEPASSVEEAGARGLVEPIALALQGALLVQHALPETSDVFCATRLTGSHTYGAHRAALDVDAILKRAIPDA